MYNVTTRGTKYSRLGKCAGHSSFVLHLDWSEDSQYLRSVSGDYELLYWSAASCRQVSFFRYSPLFVVKVILPLSIISPPEMA